MSKEKRRVPKLRFPGFTEDWEQRKLSDISTKVTTKNVDVHYMETLTNSAEQGIISQVDFFDKEISNKDNINGYYIVENNDFIYNPRISTLAPVGPINRNKLNRTGIMSPLYTVFRASNVDLGFLEWYFQSSYWHRYMKLNGDSGARADRIAIKDSTFFDMPIKTPVNIKEQVLIGEILEKFNQYITLHQRKLNNLKLKKKALLQKLFPKNGERYPELRFPGFTDAWEQRKLGSLATVEMNKRIFKEQTTIKGDIPFYKIGTFGSDADSFISRELFKEYKNKYPYPNIGDILISASGSIGRTVVYNGEDAYYQDSNIVWLNHNGKIDNSFLLQFYNQVKWAGLEGSTIKRLYNKNILETNIALPKIEEQRLIGKFFELVDRSITLHQRKLDHLQLQKKALLQQMFV